MAKLSNNTITATALVRSLSAAIDKVRMTGRSLLITKGSQTVAQLCPPAKPGFPIAQLTGLLKSLPKLGEDAVAMAQDLETIRRQAKLPENPWG